MFCIDFFIIWLVCSLSVHCLRHFVQMWLIHSPQPNNGCCADDHTHDAHNRNACRWRSATVSIVVESMHSMHCNYANVARIHCQSPDTVERWPVLVAIPALLILRSRVPENIRTPNEISSNHFIKSKSQHSYRFANGAISIFRCVTTAKHRIEMQTVVTFLSHWFTIVTHMICRAIEFVGH